MMDTVLLHMLFIPDSQHYFQLFTVMLARSLTRQHVETRINTRSLREFIHRFVETLDNTVQKLQKRREKLNLLHLKFDI